MAYTMVSICVLLLRLNFFILKLTKLIMNLRNDFTIRYRPEVTQEKSEHQAPINIFHECFHPSKEANKASFYTITILTIFSGEKK